MCLEFLDRQFNKQANTGHFVIPAKTGIQQSQGLFWIPALRCGRNGEFGCRIDVKRPALERVKCHESLRYEFFFTFSR